MIFGAKPYGNIVSEGLVLSLDATNPASYPGNGTTWYDRSGYNNNGTLTNGPTYLQERGRGSFVFDGVDDYIGIPYSNILAPTSSISFGCIAYPTNWNVSSNMKILSKTESGGYSIALNNPVSKLGAWLYAGGAYLTASYDLTSISSGWHMVMCTFDGRYFRMYLDSINVSTADAGSVVTIGYSVNNSLFIGAEAGPFTAPSGEYLAGKVSNVQLYNRALSAQEVLQNYNALKSRFNL
jgi:hypothetical protein